MEKIKADTQTGRNVGRVMWESSYGLSLTHTPLQAHLSEQQRKYCLQRMPRADLQKEYCLQAMKSTHLTQNMDSANCHSHIMQTKANVRQDRPNADILELHVETKDTYEGPTAAELVAQCPWAREEGWEVPNAWDNNEHRGRAPGKRKELTQKIGYSPRTETSQMQKGLRQLRSQSARLPPLKVKKKVLKLIGEGQNPAPVEVKKEIATRQPSAPRTLIDFFPAEVAEPMVPVEFSALPPVVRRSTPRNMWRYDDREAVFTSVVSRSHFDVMNNLKPVQQRKGRITPRGKWSRADCGLEINPCPGMRESKPHPHHFLQNSPVLTSILKDV